MNDPAILREIGEALYGPHWQSSLARDLGVAPRTIRRWAVGKCRPHHEAKALIGDMLRERVIAIEVLHQTLGFGSAYPPEIYYD